MGAPAAGPGVSSMRGECTTTRRTPASRYPVALRSDPYGRMPVMAAKAFG